MKQPIKISIAIKLFVFLFLTLMMTFVPLFFVANNALEQFGAFTNDANSRQILKISGTYLAAMAREKAGKYDQLFSRIKTSAALFAKAAGDVYGPPDHARGVQYPPLVQNPDNHIFFTPKSETMITAFWGDTQISPDLRDEIHSLSRLDPIMRQIKNDIPLSLAVHIISRSGIGKYYTDNEAARQRCFDLPPVRVFDLRNGEPFTIFTKPARPDYSPKWTSVYKDDVIDGLMMTATAPILDHGGRFRGIAGIDLPLTRITGELLTAGLYPEGIRDIVHFAFLMDAQTRLIAFPRKYFPLFGLDIKPDDFKNSSDILTHRLADSALAGVRTIAGKLADTAGKTTQLSIRQETYVLAPERLRENGWVLVLVSREGDLLSSVHETRNALKTFRSDVLKNFSISAGLIFLAALILILFTIRFIVLPIRQLTRLTRKVAEKDYSAHSPVKRNDELGELFEGFNRMIRQLNITRKLEKEHAASLAKRSRQLKQLNEHLVYSEEIERKTISSDLHDSVAQTLAIGISKIKNMRESDRDAEPDDLAEIQTFLEQAVREIRSMIYKLSPPILDDFDIDIAIGFLVEETNEQKGTRFTYINNLEDAVPLNHALKVTLYRAVNELLTNILKHAGTLEAEIELWADPDTLFIRVEDQGKGMDAQQAKQLQGTGFGLYGLSERMENFEGHLEIEAVPDKGTKIVLTAPILKETPEE